MSGSENRSWPFLFGKGGAKSGDADKRTGSRGEQLAVSFLEERGFTVLARNYRRRFGEIDIVAEEAGTLVFIEVKTRRGRQYGNPFEAVDWRKQRKLSRMAQDYICRNKLEGRAARFDVMAVQLGPDNHPHIEHIRDAFEYQE